MGGATPGPTAARPATEYNVRGQFAAVGAPQPSLRIVGLQQVSDHGRETYASAAFAVISLASDHTPALAVGEPVHGFKASSHPQGVLRHDYDATGPPATGLSKPV